MTSCAVTMATVQGINSDEQQLHTEGVQRIFRVCFLYNNLKTSMNTKVNNINISCTAELRRRLISTYIPFILLSPIYSGTYTSRVLFKYYFGMVHIVMLPILLDALYNRKIEFF